MNKIIKLFIVFVFIFSLTSCGEEEKTETTNKKQDFFVETQKLSSFSGSYEIKKTGKIRPSQDIILSSKASGRVGNINVGVGESVFVGKNLLNLSDNVANYGLNLERSNLSTESSKLNYEQNKITLDKQVSDAEIALSKIEKDHEILKKNLDESLKSAKINLDNSLSGNFTSSGFTSKAELDYNNLINSNQEQIKSFETTSENDYLSLKNLFVDIIDYSDNILGVTTLNKDNNNSFEDYLGIKNSVLLKNTENDLLELIKFKQEKFDAINDEQINISNLDNVFLIGDEGYPKVISFLDNLEKVIDNSVENIYFTRNQIDAYKSQINGYQSNLSGKYNGFLNFKSNVTKFLNTYKDNEITLKKQLEIAGDNAQITYNKILLDSESALNNSEVALKNAKLNLENIIKTREVTLKQLENSIKLSKNSANSAYKEYSKLFVSSPVNGVVSDIMVDKGQDVSPGTPLIKLSSIGKNEVEIGLSFSEIDLVNIGNKVKIKYLNEELNGTITSISKIADDNLNYKTLVSIDSKVSLSGNIVEVLIPVKLDKTLIPLQDMKVKSDKVGEINVFKNNSIDKVLVNFGEFYSENVEILGCVDLEKDVCDNLDIIINDVSKFDLEKFNVIKK